MEQLRTVTVELMIDTNKRTVKESIHTTSVRDAQDQVEEFFEKYYEELS